MAATGLVSSGIAVTSALAGSETATQQVTRLYDVRITAVTNTGSTDFFQRCNKRATTDARHTWSSFYRGVPFRFQTRAGSLRLSSAVKLGGSTTGAVSYNDNGYGCEVPPCRVSWKGRASATFTVLPSARAGRQYVMQFVAPWGGPTLPFDKCVDLYGQQTYGPTYGVPGTIQITRRRPGSSHRVTAGWGKGTSVEVLSNARPTPAKLAYPMNAIYAGKPLTIRVVDTQDETKLFDSFNGVVTITLTPRRRR